MLAYVHKYFWLGSLLLPLLLGGAVGHLAAVITEIRLSGSLSEVAQRRLEPTPSVSGLPLSSYETILQRNIFDSRGPAAGFLATVSEASAEPTARPANLALLGTLVAGERSRALLFADRETTLLGLDEELSGGGRIKQIERQRVVISWPDGAEQELLAAGASPPNQGRPAADSGQGIRSAGDNHWLISSAEIEKARANFNQLMASARLEPKIVQGQTQGFLVHMVRPNSLLARLDIQRGDLIKEVNGVPLDSPESALQVFQQLREARRVTVNLLRRGQPLSHTYEID